MRKGLRKKLERMSGMNKTEAILGFCKGAVAPTIMYGLKVAEVRSKERKWLEIVQTKATGKLCVRCIKTKPIGL